MDPGRTLTGAPARYPRGLAEVGDGGWAWVQPNGAWGEANAGLVVGDVVFAADVLFAGSTPIMWAGPVERWLAALDTLLSLDAAVYVPGHGPVGGREQVEDLREYWGWLDAEVRARHGSGMSATAATREIVALPGLGPWREWECPERIVVNVATMYRNLDDEPAPSSPVDRARLFWQVAGLAHDIGSSPG